MTAVLIRDNYCSYTCAPTCNERMHNGLVKHLARDILLKQKASIMIVTACKESSSL